MHNHKNRTEKNKPDSLEFYNSLDLIFKPEDPKYLTFLLTDIEKFVKIELANSITKTQMRNLFELIKSCKSDYELKMIKPKLIYTASRLNGKGKDFVFHLAKKVNDLPLSSGEKSNSREALENMQKFIETVLAYHKFYANS